MVKGVLALQRLRDGLPARAPACGGNTRRKRASRISLRTLVLATFALIGDAAYAAAFDEFVVTSNPGDDGYYAAGDTIEVRADFDETVEAHNNPELRLRLTIGSQQRLAVLAAPLRTATSTPITTATTTPVSARRFTFQYVVQDGDDDDDGISIAANAFRYGYFEDPTTDARVNVAAAVLGTQAGHRVDAVRPHVENFLVTSNPGPDNTYGIGDHIEIEVNFDDDIRVSGRPQLYLSLGDNTPGALPGPLTRRATLERTFARRLVFRYVVQAGDEDSDGLRISANALRGGTIEDLRGNPAIRRLDARTVAGHNVDGIVPTVRGVEIVSEPARGNTYGRGEDIVVEVTFADEGDGDQSVYLADCPAGFPWLDLSIGTRNRRALYVTGGGTARFRFNYTVLAQDDDDDGISIPANAVHTEEGDEGCVEDAAGNVLPNPTRIVPVQQQPNHRVDGGFVTPTATEVRIPSGPPAGQGDNYRLGDAIEIEVEFNVPVHAGEDADGNAPQLVVTVGGRDARAELVAGSGTNTLTFRYVVQAGDLDSDGISIAPNALNGGTIQDAEGNIVVRRTVGLTSSRGHKVDAVRPAALPDGIEIASRGPYGLSEAIRVEVTLNESVWITEADDNQLELVLTIGSRSRTARFVGGSGTRTLRFRYIVRRGDLADGISIGPNALVGGIIADAAGNAWNDADRRLTPLSAQSGHRVDAGLEDDGAPLVQEVQFADRNDTHYGLGEAIRVEVEFTETVYASGGPTLALEVGAGVRQAQLVDGSGSDTLEFSYKVQANDRDTDGVSIGPDALSGGRIVDAAGNEAVREFRPVSAEDSPVTVRVDGVPPEAIRVGIVSEPERSCMLGDREPHSCYGVGDEIKVDVRFAEPVYVTETGSELQLVLSIGEHSRRARYATGSGSDTLVFLYTVQTGDFDDDGISIGPDALIGGLIEDGVGNDWGEAERRLPPTEADPTHKVDGGGGGGTVPAVQSVEITPPQQGGKYRLGENINVRVVFDNPVYVVAADQLTLRLSIGEHTRQAAFLEGSGNTTLLFRYTVQDGDYDNDGISIGASALVGGQIQDAGGNPVRREFPAKEADRRYRVDAIRPTATATIATKPFRGDTYRIGENIEVDVVFSEPVRVRTTGDKELLLIIGEESKAASLVDEPLERRRTLKFRYRVLRGDADANGIAIAADALRADDLVDDDGNPAVLTLTALADQDDHKVDGAPVASAFEVQTLTLGQSPLELNLAQVLAQLDVYFAGQFAAPRNTAPETVSAEISGRRLVLAPRAEGTAQVLVTDGDCGPTDDVCAIALAFVVTVQATPAEVAVLKDSLAAVGRSLMAGAANTIGARLEMSKYGPHTLLGGRPLPRRLGALTLDDDRAASTVGGDPFHAPWAAADSMSVGAQRAQERFAFSRMLRGTAFEMPLVGGSSGRSSWALWGAGDYQTVAGKPEQGSYDGEVASVYLGLDGRGDSWVAGGAVARTRAEMDYAYGTDAGSVGAASGKGTVTTDLTAFHPYFQWSLGRKGQAWVMGGFGTGEAELEREGAAAPLPSDITMTMGMAGMRLELGRPGGLDFALRGDIGTTDLKTDDGVRALDDIEVSTQRARVGIEASLPLVIEGGSALTPFVDVGARVDEGDGETGNGVEVAAGVRYGGKTVRFEAKARQLVMHDAEEYEETGAAATLVVAPGSNRRGLSLSVAPRWGGAADATDMLWRQDSAFSAVDAARRFQEGREQDARWGVAGRVGYGLPLKQRKGTVTPFGEVDMSAAEQQRTRIGVKYAIDQLGSAGGMQFEFSGERVERERGTDHRFSVTAQGRF